MLTSCLCHTVTQCADILSVPHCHAVCRHPVSVTLSRCGHIYSSRPPIPTIFFPDVYLSQSSIYIHLPFFPLHISYRLIMNWFSSLVCNPGTTRTISFLRTVSLSQKWTDSTVRLDKDSMTFPGTSQTTSSQLTVTTASTVTVRPLPPRRIHTCTFIMMGRR